MEILTLNNFNNFLLQMSEMSVDEIFPELLKLSSNPLPLSQFTALPYFSKYTTILNEKQCRVRAEKSYKHFKLVKVKRGTVLYGCDDVAERGYILLHGAVQLLKKKSSREKTESFPNHFLHTSEEKQNYLHENFKIPRTKAEALTNLFYEQKIEFKFLPLHTLITRQQFGFGEMLRNTTRSHAAIAIQQSQLLIIQKSNFEDCLRDFHQKKETALIMRILSGNKSEIIEQMLPKMLGFMNLSLLLTYDNEDLIYNQSQFPSELYFIIEGEVQIRKVALLTVPKKYMKHEIKDPIEKEMTIKVCKIGKNSFFGEEQIFSGRRNRNSMVVSTLNNTLILKIDHSVFMKSINDFSAFEKLLIENAVYKKSNSDEAFEKQYNKALKSFLNQYEAFDNKKKQKMLSNLLNQSEKKTKLFEAFAPEGVFFRDTFQKLEGFDEAEKSPNKRTAIKRFKQKSTNIQQPLSSKMKEGDKFIERATQNLITEKILFSPKRSLNIAQFYAQDLNGTINQSQTTQITPKKQGKSSIEKIQFKKHKSISKFNQIEKDEAIYKRVLIKNGLYPIDKNIDKSKSVKALVHHNFDEVIKQCVSRKNQALKRSSKQKQDEIVVESFQRTVQSMKNKSVASMSSLRFSRFTTPCKGTEQLKKRMQCFQNVASGRLSDLSHIRKKSIIAKIEECIGVNQKPKSSQVSMRSKLVGRASSHNFQQRSPEKLVLLNHMMKPITYYNSTEL